MLKLNLNSKEKTYLHISKLNFFDYFMWQGKWDIKRKEDTEKNREVPYLSMSKIF